jgi:hypothetical protein
LENQEEVGDRIKVYLGEQVMGMKGGGGVYRNDRGPCEGVLVSVVLNCELYCIRVLLWRFDVLNELLETNSRADGLLFPDLILCAVKQHEECMNMLHAKST